MSAVFLISDTHFGHIGVCKFLRGDGTKLRPWATPEEMDEALIQNWNATVGPKDLVYHLGDVVINRRCLPTVGRLNGRKRLIRGNHDTFRLNEYTPYFEDVLGSHQLDGMILTHIPIHPAQLRRFGTNVHGHMHANRVEKDCGIVTVVDPRYFCVSVEHTDYRPLSLEEVRARIEDEQA